VVGHQVEHDVVLANALAAASTQLNPSLELIAC
jgi:hypothetical protein